MVVSVKMDQVHKIVKKWLSSTLPDDCKPYSRLEIEFGGEGYLHLPSFNILALKLHGNQRILLRGGGAKESNECSALHSAAVNRHRLQYTGGVGRVYLFTASKHWRRLPGKFSRRFCSKGCIPSKISTSPLLYLDEKHDSVCDVPCWWRSRRKKGTAVCNSFQSVSLCVSAQLLLEWLGVLGLAYASCFKSHVLQPNATSSFLAGLLSLHDCATILSLVFSFSHMHALLSIEECLRLLHSGLSRRVGSGNFRSKDYIRDKVLVIRSTFPRQFSEVFNNWRRIIERFGTVEWNGSIIKVQLRYAYRRGAFPARNAAAIQRKDKQPRIVWKVVDDLCLDFSIILVPQSCLYLCCMRDLEWNVLNS